MGEGAGNHDTGASATGRPSAPTTRPEIVPAHEGDAAATHARSPDARKRDRTKSSF